jgi:hypothetical protein
LATPALAGWSLLPPVHGVTGCVAGIVWHRTAETPASAAAAVNEVRPATHVALLTRLSAPMPVSAPARVPAPRSLFAPLPALPHAARAP